ncbi:hypothetical protein CLV49_0004 [Labedella gwakjiensis]|uniref:Bacterial Ig domain-containing protein n=1 Tax=Labedella gwakjiensis TaxID=390269 RepID=A0A2P8GR43_9MICO|nr:hypothetical protein [Labedella gwakjiensis]PSL36415.1 hypothetical protein CLV49_0004 [Labedella gwakjiensis]RUQ85655.1 hypothetical protein ELQ93_01035 [Labedella gwakjiensis]
MAEQGTAKREAVRIEGASWAAGSRSGRASIPAASRRLPPFLSSLRILAAVVLIAAGISVVSLGGGAAVANAATDPGPTPSPSTIAPDEPEIGAPTFTAPTDGAVITSASTTVSGSKTAGSGVQIQNGAGDVLCVVDASPATSFSCSVTLGYGAVTIQAIATDADGSGADARVTISVTSVPPPTIASGGSTPGNGLVRGTGIPGATITVTASSGETCTSKADTSGAWACLLTGGAADGAYRITATQVASFAPSARSDASAARQLVLDRTAPSPPTLSSPTGGSSLAETDARFEGTGENGATVTVFAGSSSVCQAIVSGGVWSCVAARLPGGDLRIVAIQRDIANNTSSGSSAVDIVVGGTTPSPSATPTPSIPSPSDQPAETPAPTEVQPTPVPAQPTPDTPSSPSAPSPEASPWGGDAWDAATPFTTPRAPLFSSGSVSGWVGTFLLAALVLAGIALSTQLVTGAGAGSGAGPTRTPGTGYLLPSRTPRFTGRNRRSVTDDERVGPVPSSVTTVVAALIAVAGLLILSKPVDGTPAYARLLFASVTATFLVALVSVAAPAVVARLLGAGRIHTTVDPRGFAIIAVSVATSRILGLEPPLLFALVLTASTALVVRRATEGRVAAARILALAGLGGASWALGSVLSLDGGFASSLVTETLNLVTAAALGSAALMMIPVGASAGQSLWAASRPAWFGIGFVVVTVELVQLGSRTPEMTSSITSGGTAVAVAVIAVSASLWIWRRHVAPILEDEDTGAADARDENARQRVGALSAALSPSRAASPPSTSTASKPSPDK